MSKQLPYYKMYPADAETDEYYRSMTFEQRGFFWTALNHSWLNDGLPVEDEALMRLFGLRGRKQFNSIESVIRSCFVSDGKRLRNNRQEQERIAAITKSKRAADSVRSRYERSSDDSPRAVTRAESESESESSVKSRKKEKPEVYLGQNADFDTFWAVYWRKVDKVAARKSYLEHVNSHELADKVLIAVNLQNGSMLCKEAQVRPHAATWLNHHRWEDEPDPQPNGKYFTNEELAAL